MVLADPSPAAGRWLWLFPASYAVHIADKGLTGEGFYRWIGRISGREITPRFVGFNLAYLAAMTVLVRRATRRSDAAWLLPALSGPSRRRTAAATRSAGARRGHTPAWRPVLASGLRSVRWPWRARARELARDVWRRGIAAGLLSNAVVAILALAVSHKR